MLSFFPTPYPDELWYSVLCRYHIRSGNSKKATTLKELFDKKNHAAIGNFFPNNSIHDVYAQLPKDVFSIRNIVLDHTLFRYFTRIYAYNKKNEMLNKIENGMSETPTHIWKASKSLPEIRYCPICKKEDELEYGESYWHLEHQLPLVYTCRKHGCELIRYKLAKRNQLNETFILPGDVEGGEKIEEVLGPRKCKEELARTIYDYQYLPLEVGQTHGHNNLFIELVNQGYGRGSRDVNITIDSEKVYQDLCKYFGEPFIQKIFGEHIQSAIFLRIKNWKLMSPDRYAVLAVFLGQSANTTFSEKPIRNNLSEQIKELKSTGIIYQKKYVADQLGVKTHQLDKLVKDNGIDPFWVQIDTKKRTEVLRMYLTHEEKKLIEEYTQINNFPNMSCFVRHCVMEFIENKKTFNKKNGV